MSEETKVKGMRTQQKKRIGQYMDDFRKQNGGCLCCAGKQDPDKVISPVFEFNSLPDFTETTSRLFLYGLCEKHSRVADSDQIAEFMAKGLADTKGHFASQEKAVAVLIDFKNKDKETRKFL